MSDTYWVIVLRRKQFVFFSHFDGVEGKRKFKNLEAAKNIGERLKRELKIAGIKVNVKYEMKYK